MIKIDFIDEDWKLKRSIILTDPQLAFLEKEAKRLGITVSDLIRRIIDQHRQKLPPKERT